MLPDPRFKGSSVKWLVSNVYSSIYPPRNISVSVILPWTEPDPKNQVENILRKQKGWKPLCEARSVELQRLGKGSAAAGNSQPESAAEFINQVKSFGALEKALKCSNH